MYQCLGLATEQEGGCGEDWWHPECLLGLPRNWYLTLKDKHGQEEPVHNGAVRNMVDWSGQDEDHPVPPEFSHEDEIDTLICYKCTAINPWIKSYAGSTGFLTPLLYKPKQPTNAIKELKTCSQATSLSAIKAESQEDTEELSRNDKLQEGDSNVQTTKKRKLEESGSDTESVSSKKFKTDGAESGVQNSSDLTNCRIARLPDPPAGSFSLIASDEDFRSRFCRCAECYPPLSKHPQLLEEEESYEPPLSEDEDDAEGAGSVGTGSLLERGEAALSNVDRVRAIGTSASTLCNVFYTMDLL